jgi:DNA repair protein RadD
MVELRSYQHEALVALFQYWREGGGNPLVDLPTGTGKSFLIGDLSRRFVGRGRRVLIVSHVREIISQDAAALCALWPDMPLGTLGINSAALGERDTQAPILLATVQSIFRNPQALGRRNLLIVDEAQRIPKSDTGMFHATIAGLRELYPQMRVAGFTATPYRLDSGRLDQGKTRLFDRVVYSYGIADAVRDGWLSPLVAKSTESEIDTSGVGRRGGEFILADLERAADQAVLVGAAVAEIVHYGAGRRNGWLAFCCGVDHALHVRDVLRSRGVSCETIVGTTPAGEREQIIADYRAGKILCLTGCDVFTTGFDVAHVDLIALLRPTLSTGLYVQMAGRGTRKAPGKQNCLLLDFGSNVMRHGPVDAVDVQEREPRGRSVAHAKTCPDCKTMVAPAIRKCPDCGFTWPVQARAPSHTATAASISPLGNEPVWWDVNRVELSEHIKPDRPPSLRIDFYSVVQRVPDWLPFEHSNGARWHAADKWAALGGRNPAPRTVREALTRRHELAAISAIQVRRDGPYWRVVAVRRERDA